MNQKAHDPKWLNQTFNNLTVVGFVRKNGLNLWKCHCSKCGNVSELQPNSVRSGRQSSCKCSRGNHSNHDYAPFFKHGHCYTRLYRIWFDMRKRCNNPKCQCFNRYGGRGISVCAEWNSNYIKFYEWAMSNGYAENLTIDRIDNNGNYEPNNCKWSDRKTQAINRSNNKIQKGRL